MSKRVSNTVQGYTRKFYARLATAAARQAVLKVKENNVTDAQRWAVKVEDWLIEAGAHATEWQFRLPEA